MWNSGFHIIWFSLRMENGKHFRLSFPISLDVFRELLDSILDITALACVFASKTPRPGSHGTVHTARALVEMVIALLGTVTDDGPYELVDVRTENVKVLIKIR